MIEQRAFFAGQLASHHHIAARWNPFSRREYHLHKLWLYGHMLGFPKGGGTHQILDFKESYLKEKYEKKMERNRRDDYTS